MANTPSSPVRQNSSTTTNPRSSTLTPTPSSPRRSANGRRPTEHDDRFDLDVLAVAEAARWCRPCSFGGWPLDHHPGADVDLLLLEAIFTTTLARSLSRPREDLRQALEDRRPRRRGRRAPRANSQPIAPPTDRRPCGRGRVVEIEHLVADHDRPVALEAGKSTGAPAPARQDARWWPVISMVDHPSLPVDRDCGRGRGEPTPW